MARVIAAANLKGGVGKSTLTINLAAAMESAGERTGIIDIDAEQQAAARWKDVRGDNKPPIVISPVHTRLPQAVAELVSKGVELERVCADWNQEIGCESAVGCDSKASGSN